MKPIYTNRETSKVLQMFEEDDFWSTKTSPTKKEKEEETNIELINVKKKEFVFNLVNKEKIESVVDEYCFSNKIIKSDSVKRLNTAKAFIVESLVLILNSMKTKQCVWNKETYPTKKEKGEETIYKATSRQEIKTLCDNNYFNDIVNLLNIICHVKKHKERNVYSIKKEYLNNDNTYKVEFKEKINKTTGEITIPALLRWNRQMNFFKTMYGSGKNIDIENEELFKLKWPTVLSVERLLNQKIDSQEITLQSLKKKQQKLTLEENTKNWLNTYKDCLVKLENNPANKSSIHSRIYSAYNCLPKEVRTIVNEINEKEEIDVSSMFPNILLAIATGTLKNKDLPYRVFALNDMNQLGVAILNKHITISTKDKIYALKTLGGKFRQKLCQHVSLSEPKTDLMTYLNCSSLQHVKIQKNLEITQYLCHNEGTKALDEILILMKKNWRRKTNLVKELLESIEAQIMQEFQIKLYDAGIPSNLIHDAISVPKDKVEIVKQMLEEHLTEWGIPTENNIEILCKRILEKN